MSDDRRCSTVLPLATPPGVDSSGKYIVIVNQYGVTRLLARPTNRSVLVYDGDDIYFVDGTDALPFILNNIPTIGVTGVFNGLLVQNGAGRVFLLVNETTGKKVLKSVSGQIFWDDDDVNATSAPVPLTGHGWLGRTADDVDPQWFNAKGLLTVNSAGEPVQIDYGTAGQVLQMDGDTPVFKQLPNGNIASGSTTATLESVAAQILTASTITITIPSMRLTNGVDDIVVANVNVVVDLTASVGLLGLDTGAEQASKWYYVYITSDGTDVSAIISLNGNAPDLSATTHTYYGFCTVFRNNSAGNITQFVQRGRRYWTEKVIAVSNGASTTALNNISFSTPLASIVPPIVKTVGGIVGGSNTSGGNVVTMQLAADTTGLGLQIMSGKDNVGVVISGFKRDVGTFSGIPILDPAIPAFAWASNANDTHRQLVINNYTV